MGKVNVGGKGSGTQVDRARLPTIAASPMPPGIMRVRHGRFEVEGPANHVAVVTIANRILLTLGIALGSGGAGVVLVHWVMPWLYR